MAFLKPMLFSKDHDPNGYSFQGHKSMVHISFSFFFLLQVNDGTASPLFFFLFWLLTFLLGYILAHGCCPELSNIHRQLKQVWPSAMGQTLFIEQWEEISMIGHHPSYSRL
jgi:hypothetical protein